MPRLKEHNTGGVVLNWNEPQRQDACATINEPTGDALIWFAEIDIRVKLAKARKLHFQQKEQAREREWERIIGSP